MSDYKDSTVTYTVVSSPFADLPNIESPGVDGPPVMPDDPYAYVVAAFQAPPSLDYVPGPEYPPSPEFVLEPVYPEFMPPEDEILPVEEQPLPAAVSPTAVSPAAVSPIADLLGYVPESDPEEDLEEDYDEDPEEDPADYPADGGDDGDDEDESSDDDEDEDVDIEGDEEEEEHPALADSTAIALPAVDQAPSAEKTKPFETDESVATPPPHPAYRVTARISIRDETPISLPPREEVERLLAMPTPPLSPLSPWSSPLPQIPSPPLPPILSPPPPQIPLLPLPVSSPVPVLSPSPPASIALGPRYKIGESSSAAAARPTGGLKADYGFVATMDREIRRDLERDVGYGIIDSWDEIVEAMQGTPIVTDVAEFSQRMTEFETRVRQDTDEICTRLDDEQTRRQLLAGWLNMLFRDRRAHARIARPMETEARMSGEAWGRSMDASDLVRADIMSLRTTMLAQQSEIRELQLAD
ncbi:hypothetical protein Tco_1513308, partial [Tanacetum coccineum]